MFKVDAKTGAETVLHSFGSGADGYFPAAGLTFMGGVLYGTTEFGGASGNGTLFKVDPATGTETVLHSFTSHGDGLYPVGTLLSLGGCLYGTTSSMVSHGTAFKFILATGALTTLHRFTGGADGAYPRAGLIYKGGFLYGTTFGDSQGGNPTGNGTVFKLTP